MSLKIESSVYRILYRKLCDRIVEDIYPGETPKFKTPNKRELFDIIERKPIASRLTKDSGKESPKYFYRLAVDLSLDTIRGVIDPFMLFNALVELGYTLGDNYIQPGLGESTITTKAQNLLNQFIATHLADIKEERKKIDLTPYLNSEENDDPEENGIAFNKALASIADSLTKEDIFSRREYQILKRIGSYYVLRDTFKKFRVPTNKVRESILTGMWSIWQYDHPFYIERNFKNNGDDLVNDDDKSFVYPISFLDDDLPNSPVIAHCSFNERDQILMFGFNRILIDGQLKKVDKIEKYIFRFYNEECIIANGYRIVLNTETLTISIKPNIIIKQDPFGRVFEKVDKLKCLTHPPEKYPVNVKLNELFLNTDFVNLQLFDNLHESLFTIMDDYKKEIEKIHSDEKNEESIK